MEQRSEFYEHECIELLGKMNLPFFRTGSREICDPAPTDTDADFVLLDLGKADLEKHGFLCLSLHEYGGNSGMQFEVWQKGECQIIAVCSWPDFRAWKAATSAAKAQNITDKTKRQALFQGILHGNWDWKP